MNLKPNFSLFTVVFLFLAVFVTMETAISCESGEHLFIDTCVDYCPAGTWVNKTAYYEDCVYCSPGTYQVFMLFIILFTNIMGYSLS